MAEPGPGSGSWPRRASQHTRPFAHQALLGWQAPHTLRRSGTVSCGAAALTGSSCPRTKHDPQPPNSPLPRNRTFQPVSNSLGFKYCAPKGPWQSTSDVTYLGPAPLVDLGAVTCHPELCSSCTPGVRRGVCFSLGDECGCGSFESKGTITPSHSHSGAHGKV